MNKNEWTKEFPCAITICDPIGTILEMNDKAIKTFENDGGAKLVGQNVLACHPEPARTQLQELLESAQTNVYTIEKKGVKKLIYQAPWYKNDKYCGMVELSIEIPFEMPHLIRQ